MKKSYPTDIHQKEGQEHSKKLYRYISDQVKTIDDARGCARAVGELFTPISNIQRSKFREYCERLIFSNPLLHGRKGEELLWRKAFYEVVVTAKRLKKNEYSAQEKAYIENHINVGIGHYHHFIARLQQEYDLDLNGVVDFIICDNNSKKPQNNEQNNELTEWAKLSVHRCLIYLGDLCRYKLDIYPNWDNNLATRYYQQALCFKPEYGMPHNQMGTLVTNINNSLDSTYHYLRSLDCKHIFEGTENNLHRLFEKNSHYLEQLPVENDDADCIVQPEPSEHIKRFVARFLLLVDVWWFNKKIPQIYDLCHQTNVDLQECMTYLKTLASESIDTNVDTVDTDSTNSPAYLTHDVIFKIVSMCLVCVHKITCDRSQHVSNVVPFTLAVYSQLVQTVIEHIQEGVLNFPLPPIENNVNKWLNNHKHKIKKRRRRKVLRNSDEEEEENSSENESLSAFNTESDDEIVSDIELDPTSSTDEEEESAGDKKSEEKLVNGICDNKSDKSSSDGSKTFEEILKKCKQIDLNDMLAIISDEQLLQCIKILNDWLMTDLDILKTCVKSTRTLFNQVINLVNLLHINVEDPKLKDYKVGLLKDNEKKIALPEDVVLKGVQILSGSQKDLDWNYSSKINISMKEQNVLRIMKIISFGHFLTTLNETGVTYNKEGNLFTIKMDEPYLNGIDELETREVENGDADIIKRTDDLKPSDTTKGQLMKMKHMGQLWLTAEVRDLESRVKGKTALSPYLVIDADSLIIYTSMVKQLVYSRKFIVLVPSAVVSALDDLKREKLEARDAIRWLESQFHQGNRFFRAQRPQERLPIPYIKYPKKKDKDTLIYIQIIECCHYLSQQQKGASNLVTLLLGNPNVFANSENRDFSYVGLAQSAGINLELITEFYGKWKKTVREKR